MTLAWGRRLDHAHSAFCVGLAASQIQLLKLVQCSQFSIINSGSNNRPGERLRPIDDDVTFKERPAALLAPAHCLKSRTRAKIMLSFKPPFKPLTIIIIYSKLTSILKKLQQPENAYQMDKGSSPSASPWTGT